MNDKKLFRLTGWNEDTMAQIAHLIVNTPESRKSRIIRMLGRTGWFEGNYFIEVLDGQIVKLNSRDIEDKELVGEIYDALIRRFDLPYCCLIHKQKYAPDWEDLGPDAGEEDDFAALFGSDTPDSWDLKEEEDWDI